MSQPEDFRPISFPPPGPRRSWLVSATLLFALVAVVVFAFRNLRLAEILMIVSSVPALIWLIVVAWRSKAQGRPMSFDEVVRTFAVSFGNVFLVLLSAFIAFFVTCFPIGMLGMRGEYSSATGTIAGVVGGLSAIGAGALVASLLRRHHRNRRAKALQRDEEVG